MCNGQKCSCSDRPRRLQANLLAGEAKYSHLEGRKVLIVPLIMARSDVPMNDGIIPVEELVPYAWDGVPVTIGHPNKDGASIPANTPKNLAEWSVGRVFNAAVTDGGVLRGEAWIDVEKAEKLYPGLVSRLARGGEMDVSTGYFCDTEQQHGDINNKRYSEIHRNLRPEHLALLPDEVGACSFADGCGVRSNKREVKMKLADAIKAFHRANKSLAEAIDKSGQGPTKRKLVTPKAKQVNRRTKRHERGDDDDVRQIAADLISAEESPFLPDDEMALAAMSPDTLRKMREKFLGSNEDEEIDVEDNEDEDDVEDNEDEEIDVEDNEDEDGDEQPVQARKNKGKRHTREGGSMDELIKAMNAMRETVERSLKANRLSDEDRAALADAKRVRANRRKSLVNHIVANSRMTKDQLQHFDFATLESLADGLLPVANYGARPMPTVNESKDEATAAMSEYRKGSVHLLNQRHKKSA